MGKRYPATAFKYRTFYTARRSTIPLFSGNVCFNSAYSVLTLFVGLKIYAFYFMTDMNPQTSEGICYLSPFTFLIKASGERGLRPNIIVLPCRKGAFNSKFSKEIPPGIGALLAQ